MIRRVLLLLLLAVATAAGCAAPAPTAPSPAVGPAPAAPAVAEPVRVVISSIGVDAPLIRTGRIETGPDKGAPEVPSVFDPGQPSWATWSPRPGQPGPATLYGHVDGEVHGKQGVLGVFARIGELAADPGDAVLVRRSDDTAQWFRVYRVREYQKDELRNPNSAATREIYGDTAGPELRLVTCSGDFDHTRRSYVDQLVVFARAEP